MGRVRLTIVGCSGSVPGPASAASSYLVEQDGFRVLLDLGSGAFGALQQHLDPADVDAVVLSHLHADHCLDLTAMVVHRRYGMTGAHRIPVLGPDGTHDRMALAYDPAARGGLRDVFDFAAVTRGERELGPFRLRFERVNHPVETHAVRVSAGGRSLTYSGDTGVSEGLVTAARDADILLCEASCTEDMPHPPDLHLTGREAGEHAAKAGVGRLLVTHIPPWTDRDRVRTEATAAFAQTELVTAGTVYEI
ncbi:MAG TPA: MBL fold metallo-hydrolase [Mycobacteriales bacterium]|jgi:ribonuclease BN (tRNA processing enzyme)|nr:MBL fold metallo-hydrolase [Mycobacteriales bacterium]